jgi:hypothetical protein
MTRIIIAFISLLIVIFVLADLTTAITFGYSQGGISKIIVFFIGGLIHPTTFDYEITAMAVISSAGLLRLWNKRVVPPIGPFATLCSYLIIFLFLICAIQLLSLKPWDGHPQSPENFEGLFISFIIGLFNIPIIAASTVFVFRLFGIRIK